MIDIDIRFPALETAFLQTFGRSIGPYEVATTEEFAWMTVEAIQAVWPVKTGASSQGWHGSAMDIPRIGVRLFNAVEYAQYVHLSGTPAEDVLWEDVVQRIADRLGGLLGAALWETAASAPAEGLAAIGGRQSLPRRALSQRPPQPPAAVAGEIIVYAGEAA